MCVTSPEAGKGLRARHCPLLPAMLGHLRLVALLLWATSPPVKGSNSRIHPAWRMEHPVSAVPEELHTVEWGCLCLIVVPALKPTESWALGSVPTLASTCCVNHGIKYRVSGSGGDGKADWCGCGVGMGGMEPARCRDTSGPSCRHVEGLAS